MAGSYNHCVTEATGKLRSPESLNSSLSNGGDVYEAIEEMYGMIWWLADMLASSTNDSAEVVEVARKHYKIGLDLSPGKSDL